MLNLLGSYLYAGVLWYFVARIVYLLRYLSAPLNVRESPWEARRLNDTDQSGLPSEKVKLELVQKRAMDAVCVGPTNRYHFFFQSWSCRWPLDSRIDSRIASASDPIGPQKQAVGRVARDFRFVILLNVCAAASFSVEFTRKPTLKRNLGSQTEKCMCLLRLGFHVLVFVRLPAFHRFEAATFHVLSTRWLAHLPHLQLPKSKASLCLAFF